MAKYLVTGGAGFIGSAIATYLIQNEHEVYIIDNLSTGFIYNVPTAAKFIQGDFSDDAVISQLPNDPFDTIFHIGGQSSGEISFEDPEYDLHTNTLSTLKLLQYCVRSNCKKFIYASTMSVYGEQPDKEQFSETDQALPKSFYAVGKLASEHYMKIFSKQFGINCISLRYFNVYGPGQNMNNMKQGMVSIYLQQFIDSNSSEILVKGSLERFRDFIYIDDVVNITINATNNSKFSNQTVNIGTGIKTSVKEVLETIRDLTSSTKIIRITEGTPGDQFGIYANTTLLNELYPHKLTSFKDGLRNMLQWILNEQ